MGTISNILTFLKHESYMWSLSNVFCKDHSRNTCSIFWNMYRKCFVILYNLTIIQCISKPEKGVSLSTRQRLNNCVFSFSVNVGLSIFFRRRSSLKLDKIDNKILITNMNIISTNLLIYIRNHHYILFQVIFISTIKQVTRWKEKGAHRDRTPLISYAPLVRTWSRRCKGQYS